MGTCPKCKTGIMRQQGFGSSNWRCELCGYKQYVAAPKANTSSSRLYSDINRINAERARNDADFNAAYKGAEAARKQIEEAAKAKRKASKLHRLLDKIIIALIVLYIISRFL